MIGRDFEAQTSRLRENPCGVATSKRDFLRPLYGEALPGRDLERLRELARQRQMEVAALGREAISAYLDGVDPHAAQERLAQELKRGRCAIRPTG